MPGWHEATLQLRQSSQIRMMGILQEQHPDRARLFTQWKGIDWPQAADPLNLLGVSTVPITVFIDEAGVVRKIQPRLEDLDEFVATAPAVVPDEARPLREVRSETLRLADIASSGSLSALRSAADALLLWGETERVTEAISRYEEVLRRDPGEILTHFRIGVAYRIRHDSPERRVGDFQRAVAHWERALAGDPNQYIWRRRLQQYGPRLEKPYPFYDWVEEARRELRARGADPAPLLVEPEGAEIAAPTFSFESAAAGLGPDPEGRIFRDEEGLIETEVVVLPSAPEAGGTVRVHVLFMPVAEKDGHWNNEVDGLVFWVDPPSGWEVDSRLTRLRNPPQEVSEETRRVEFEMRVPEGLSGSVKIPAYALYYVCEGRLGTCLYRRQDVEIHIRVIGSSGR